jgi:hypothetical protein
LADAQEFIWLNKQGVRSSEGFDVQCVGRFEFEYREGERVLRLGGEPIYSGGWGFAFDESWRSEGWQPPHQRESLTDADRQRIRQNIEAAGRFMEHKFEFA